MRVGVFKELTPSPRLMTEPDPRIALMQKWSQENPALMAQAGLATLATDASEGAGPHFIAGGMNPKRTELLHSAGVDPKAHSHHQSGHPLKKSKGKKGKGNKNNSDVKITVSGVPITIGHGHVQQQQSHKKKNPFFGVNLEKLAVVYSQSQIHYTEAVNASVSSVDTIMTKLPFAVGQAFLTAFSQLKLYKRGASAHTYETVYGKIAAVLTAYQAIHKDLKYTLHMPHTIPTGPTAGTASLLSKLINATIALLRIHTKIAEERTKFGMYEFRAQLYNMANAKGNCVEIHAALIHEQNKAAARVGLPVDHTGRMHRAESEFGTDHGAFSMAQPFAL